MRSWVRTVWVWLLVLAVPAQGAIATSLSDCKPNHHAVAALPAVLHDAASHAHSHGAQQLPGDGGRAVTSAGADFDAADSAAIEATSTQEHADKHKCSACAACCSAAVIGRIEVDVPGPDATPTVFMAVAPPIERFASGGPDRPPRVRLA